MGKFIFTNGGGLSVASGPSTTSKANSNLIAFLDAPDPVYGSAGDGSQTLDGSTTVLSMAPSSSVYTATRDLFFYNLTLSASVRLNPGGYRIFVQNILTLGSGATIGYATGFATTGSIQQGGAAGSGALQHSLGGSSETAGVTAPTALTGGTDYYKQPFQAIKGYSITGSSTTPTFLRGGAGGATGAGGGVVILAARYITVASGTAYIKAPGTAGSGGGGGGAIIIISSAASLNGSVTTDVTGGTSCNAGIVIYSQVA